MADQHLVDGVERQLEPVPAGELVAEHLDAEPALAQAEDQPSFFGEDLRPGERVRLRLRASRPATPSTW